MNNRQEKPQQLLVTYPGKRGFTMLAYEILQELMARFALVGNFAEGTDNSFSVLLDGGTVYSIICQDVDAVDRREIIRRMSTEKSPVMKAVVSESGQAGSPVPELGEWDDCFCSGE